MMVQAVGAPKKQYKKDAARKASRTPATSMKELEEVCKKCAHQAHIMKKIAEFPKQSQNSPKTVPKTLISQVFRRGARQHMKQSGILNAQNLLGFAKITDFSKLWGANALWGWFFRASISETHENVGLIS